MTVTELHNRSRKKKTSEQIEDFEKRFIAAETQYAEENKRNLPDKEFFDRYYRNGKDERTF